MLPTCGGYMDLHQQRPFTGALTAIVSPFTRDNTLDFGAFKDILKNQKQSGMNGVVVSGTTGESPTLTSDERLLLLQEALDHQDDDFSIFVGSGSNSTAGTVAEIQSLASFRHKGKGVRGIMVVVPYYNRPNQAGLAKHFAAAIEAAGSLPVCIYNVPARTGCAVHPTTFANLAAEFKNVVAIKEAAGDVLAMTSLRLALRAKDLKRPVSVLSGDDSTYAPALIAGAEGVISVTSHIIPRSIKGILKAVQCGDFAKACLLHMASFPLSQGLFCAPNPAPVKYALSLKGLCLADVRGPLAPLSDLEKDTVRRSLEQAEELGAEIL